MTFNSKSQADDPKRRPSINLYQSVDDDHPDLQSIQSIVANMNFSADKVSNNYQTRQGETVSLMSGLT